MTGLEGIELSKRKISYGQSVQSGMGPITSLEGIELSKRKMAHTVWSECSEWNETNDRIRTH